MTLLDKTEQTAWVVTGTQGEYSDQEWWVVRAFSTETEATAFVDAANDYVSKAPPALPFSRAKYGTPEYEEEAAAERARVDERAKYWANGPYDGTDGSQRCFYASISPPTYTATAAPYGSLNLLGVKVI